MAGSRPRVGEGVYTDILQAMRLGFGLPVDLGLIRSVSRKKKKTWSKLVAHAY